MHESTDFLIKLVLSLVLGGVVGLERELARKPAGLRTNILIVLGSMLFTYVSIQFAREFGGSTDPGRIAANIATGIGFIGAGTIIQTRGLVHGLTTAATIWVNGAIGIAIGVGYYFSAVATTVLTVLVLNIFERLEEYMAFKRNSRG